MRDIIRYGFILALICTIATGLLATVNSLTKDRIIAQAQAEVKSSLKEVIPQAASFEEVKFKDEVLYYKALDKNNNFIGAAFKARAKGYSSEIETMVGIDKNGTINLIKVLDQNETPGLGARVAEASFCAQFAKKNALDLAGVSAITGATISSKAVIDSIKQKAREIIKEIKNER